jgi:GntR family transcriptional regulator
VSQQIADMIRNRIADGKLGNGDALPSVRELAKAVRCSKNTVSAAYHDLRDSGLLVHGSNQQVWLIRAQPPVRNMDSERFVDEWARLVASGGVADRERTAFCIDYNVTWSQYTIASTFEIMPALETHARLLNVPAGTEVLRRELTEYAAGVPVQMRRSIMLASDVVGTDIADPAMQPYPGGTLSELWSLGHRLKYVVQGATTRAPTPREAEKLDLPGTLRALEITRQFVVVDQDKRERIGEASEQVMPADGTRVTWITRI